VSRRSHGPLPLRSPRDGRRHRHRQRAAAAMGDGCCSLFLPRAHTAAHTQSPRMSLSRVLLCYSSSIQSVFRLDRAAPLLGPARASRFRRDHHHRRPLSSSSRRSLAMSGDGAEAKPGTAAEVRDSCSINRPKREACATCFHSAASRRAPRRTRGGRHPRPRRRHLRPLTPPPSFTTTKPTNRTWASPRAGGTPS
jgi:hypothetical protein